MSANSWSFVAFTAVLLAAALTADYLDKLPGASRSPAVLRWSRNRMTVVTAVLFLLALCFATTNGWWYVSSYGVPWWDKPPSIAGKGFSTAFLGLTILALLLAACGGSEEPPEDTKPTPTLNCTTHPEHCK